MSLFYLVYIWLVVALAGMPEHNQSFYQTERPNIVWITTEDNSIDYLRLYRETGAAMPNIERLAHRGVTFEHAFSNAPVCSVARSTLISGCYAPRTGAQYHRGVDQAPMPEGLQMFPYYLRQAGYYTTNNNKEDYNLIKSEGVWDTSSRRASYRNRPPGVPFFHVQNFGLTHEGKLHFSRKQMEEQPTETGPATITPFPYHPDTEVSRYTYAKYLDLHREVDQQIGVLLDQLEEDGLMDDTIIFFFGDHGGVLPRSKGYVYESGLHVPLVVYVPEKWAHLSPYPPGSRAEPFVSFVDFGPTVLAMAGIEVPLQMDGRAFFGESLTRERLHRRNTTFGYADRFDEKVDMVRSFRRGRFKYIRNYQPFNYDGLYNFYRYRMLLYQEWDSLYRTGALDVQQEHFFQPRPAEQLFDITTDPYEVDNLSDDPAYRDTLHAMRETYRAKLAEVHDLSFFPEPYLLEAGIDNPVAFGNEHQELLTELQTIADLELLPFASAKKGIRRALNDANPWKRYWGLIVCSAFGEEASVFFRKAKQLAKDDPENLVSVRALEFLALTDQMDPEPGMLKALRQATTQAEANLIMNTVTLLQNGHGYSFDIDEELFPTEWVEEEQKPFIHRFSYLRTTN
jgi:arylsulfatase A-like enzyme